MNDDQKVAELEAVLAQFLRPIRGIPFSVIVKSISEQRIIPINLQDAADRHLVDSLVALANVASDEVARIPIIRPRPNEVGNDIEPHVIKAARQVGLRAERPKTKSGKLKTTGYPDILIYDTADRPTYLECKVYGQGTDKSSMRSFYVSPSDDFKVTVDARHVLIAFGVEGTQIQGSRNSSYVTKSFKIVDLSGLKCDVKYEFNSDNKRLYGEGMLLASGDFSA